MCAPPGHQQHRFASGVREKSAGVLKPSANKMVNALLHSLMSYLAVSISGRDPRCPVWSYLST